MTLLVTQGAAASVQSNWNQARTEGLFEVDATLPTGQPGLIVAPLYLYGRDGHEVDFEVVGTRGLQLAVHTAAGFNAYNRLIPGDFAGRRRFGVEYRSGHEIRWLVDGAVVQTVKPSDLRLPFPHHPLKPYAEIWPTLNSEWAGRWSHRDAAMVLHGYRLS